MIGSPGGPCGWMWTLTAPPPISGQAYGSWPRYGRKRASPPTVWLPVRILWAQTREMFTMSRFHVLKNPQYAFDAISTHFRHFPICFVFNMFRPQGPGQSPSLAAQLPATVKVGGWVGGEYYSYIFLLGLYAVHNYLQLNVLYRQRPITFLVSEWFI